jgi:hypothetical protein
MKWLPERSRRPSSDPSAPKYQPARKQAPQPGLYDDNGLLFLDEVEPAPQRAITCKKSAQRASSCRRRRDALEMHFLGFKFVLLTILGSCDRRMAAPR